MSDILGILNDERRSLHKMDDGASCDNRMMKWFGHSLNLRE